jgi:hypothetical protein
LKRRNGTPEIIIEGKNSYSLDIIVPENSITSRIAARRTSIFILGTEVERYT